MGMRRGVAAATTVMIVMALCGCSVIDDVTRTGGAFVDGAVIDSALDGLTADLDKITGVTVTGAASEMQSDYTYRVSVDATSSGPLSEADAVRVLEAVRSTFASDALAGRSALFQLESEDTPLSLDGSAMSASELAGEVAYFYALADAYGSPLGLTLGSTRDDSGVETGYQRGIRSLGGRPADVGALVDVADTTTGQHEWELAGLSASGTLPGADVFALLDSLAEVAPELDYASSDRFTGVHLQWYGDRRVVHVALVSDTLVAGAALSAAPDIETARLVVARAVQSRVALGQFSFYADDGSVFATVRFTPCTADEQNATALDLELATALGSDSVVPGVCAE